MLSEYKKVNSIRLLPMSKDEIFTYSSVENFLNYIKTKRNGTYFFRKRTIVLNDGDTALVLFQMSGQLVGAAIMVSQKIEDSIDEQGLTYNGYYTFDSIITFDEPITKEEFKVAVPTFNSFGQSAQKIDMEYIEDVCLLINRKTLSAKTKTRSINTPEHPITIKQVAGKIIYECGNCNCEYDIAPRCPECGQLVTSYDELMQIEKYRKMIN